MHEHFRSNLGFFTTGLTPPLQRLGHQKIVYLIAYYIFMNFFCKSLLFSLFQVGKGAKKQKQNVSL